MKVLVCIPCLSTGGTEIQTLSLVEALVAADHEVVVACYFEYADPMVERYQNAGATVELLSPEGTRSAGIKNTIKHLLKGLRTVVKKYHPDVAHVQYMAPGALPVVILKILGVRKIVATSHTPGDIYTTNGLRIIRFLTNHVLTAFQCITELAELSYFGDSKLFNGTLSRHFTIYNNIPSHISISDYRRLEKSDDEDICIGVVSRLEPIKGMDLVIPAFAKAFRYNSRLKLLVVGDGTLRELMVRQVNGAGIKENVEFVGRQPQFKLQDYYDQIDILLMPSRSEGFGLTAIEGMARGCVPIVSKVGGLPEVVTSDCGMLHAPENTNDLASKIVDISSDTLLLCKMSAASIEKSRVYSTKRYNQAIKQLYKVI